MKFAQRVRGLASPQWARRAARTAETPPTTAEWTRALLAGRASATATALTAFISGLTLDDLHLFRIPMVYIGLAAAIISFAFLPPFSARRLVRRARVDAPGDPARLIEAALTRRRAVMGLVIAATVVWLVLFSSGRTPRW